MRVLHAVGVVSVAFGFVMSCSDYGFEEELRAIDSGGVEKADGSVDLLDAGIFDAMEASDDSARPSRIYVLGGGTEVGGPPNAAGATYFAEVQPDGELGTWQLGPALPTGRQAASVVVGDDFVAMGGGQTPSGFRSTFVIGHTKSGFIDGFTESPQAFEHPRTQSGLVRHGDTVFLLGGLTSTTVTLSDVKSGFVTAKGVSSFQDAGTLPYPIARMAVVQSDTNVYLVGGEDGAGAKRAEILSARLVDGNLSTFEQAALLPQGTSHLRAIVYRSALIVVGGVSASSLSSVLVYPILAGGDLGEGTPTLSVPVPVARHQLLVYKDCLYVIGGTTTTGISSSVYVGDLSSSGSVLQWRETTPLPEPVQFHSAVLL